jgi:hypothetical protein
MYFRHLLYNKSGRFRKDMLYVLHAAVSMDMMMLKTIINIFMNIHRPAQICGSTCRATASDVRNMFTNTDTMSNSYMFMKKHSWDSGLLQECIV